MTNLGKIKVINTEYSLYSYKEYKEINENSTKWDKEFSRSFDESKVVGISGYCLTPIKEIHFFDGFSPIYNEQTLRHEIIHAFLYEIGFAHWDDEELVEKLSIWYPMLEESINQGRKMIENARVKEEPRSTQDSEACISNSK